MPETGATIRSTRGRLGATLKETRGRSACSPSSEGHTTFRLLQSRLGTATSRGTPWTSDNLGIWRSKLEDIPLNLAFAAASPREEFQHAGRGVRCQEVHVHHVPRLLKDIHADSQLPEVNHMPQHPESCLPLAVCSHFERLPRRLRSRSFSGRTDLWTKLRRPAKEPAQFA